MEIFNEVTNLILVYHMLTFTDWVADPRMRYQLGFSVILCVLMNVSVHFTFLIASTIKKLRLNIIKKIAKRKALKLAKKKAKVADPKDYWLKKEEES